MEPSTDLWIFVFAGMGVIFTKLFYWLLELQNPKIEAQKVLAYQSAAHFIAGKPTGTEFIKFFSFRMIPNALSTVFVIGISSEFRHLTIQDLVLTILIATIFGNLGTFLGVCNRNNAARLRLLHALVSVKVLFGNLLIIFIQIQIDFIDAIFPSSTSFKEGVWTSLLTTLLVAFYLRAFAMSRSNSTKDHTHDIHHGVGTHHEINTGITDTNFKQSIGKVGRRTIRKKFRELRVYEKVFKESAKMYHLPPSLLEAIVIHETFNRPKLIRRFENLLVRLPSIKLSVGLSQIQSNHPLSDEESIKELASRMALARDESVAEGLIGREVIEAVLLKHNGNYAYVESVLDYFWELEFFRKKML